MLFVDCSCDVKLLSNRLFTFCILGGANYREINFNTVINYHRRYHSTVFRSYEP